MFNCTALHRGGLALLCLMLALAWQPVFAQSYCPDLPRQLDECTVCLILDDDDGWFLEFGQRAFIHNPVTFKFGDFPSDITISVDFADGNGQQSILHGSAITVSYPNINVPTQYELEWNISIEVFVPLPLPGNLVVLTKTEKQKIQTNFNPGVVFADQMPHTTWGNLTGNTYSPPSGNAYPAGSSYNNPVASGGIVHVQYANPDHVLRKPFILVEGFDPILKTPEHYAVHNNDGTLLGYGSLRWDVVVTGRNEAFDDDMDNPNIPHTSQFALLPDLVAQIKGRGYDLVYVDFADAGTYIQANADFLIEVLEKVKAEKVGDEQAVLVGASMGGIVSRYALAKMEKEGKSHCVGLFGTFDTPHNGANIPLSVQGLGWFYHATGASEEIWAALNTPAARQQTILQLGDQLQSGNLEIDNIDIHDYFVPLNFDELFDYDYASLRNTLVGDLASVGWPKQTRKIALLDGQINGSIAGNQGFGPGEKFFDANFFAGEDFGTVYRTILRSVNSYGSDNIAVHGIDPCPVKFSVYYPTYKSIFSIAAPHDSDPCLGNNPPKRYNAINLNTVNDLPHLDNAPGGYRLDIASLRAQLKDKTPDNVTFTNNTYFPVMSFVPTWSALAMGTPLENSSLFVNLDMPEFEEVNLPNLKIPNFNRFYAPVNNLRHVELDAGMVSFILEELDELEADKFAGNTLAETYNFGLRRTQIPNLMVQSGGQLNINNNGPTGYVQSNPGGAATKLTFTTYLNECGQVLTVENGGEYNIGANNKSQHGITEAWESAIVHIKSGGILRITSEGSALIIKSGATLILDPGAKVILESNGANIRIEGELVVNGNFNFSGLGHFVFAEGNKLTFGPNHNTFYLDGMGINQRYVRLEAPVRISDGHRLLWTDGLVEITDGNLDFTTGAGADFERVTFSGGGEAIIAQQASAINLLSCVATGVQFPILGDECFGLYVDQCQFNGYSIGITWQNSAFFNVVRSSFAGQSAASAMDLQNVGLAMIGADYIAGHTNGAPGIVDDAYFSSSNAAAAEELSNVDYCVVRNSQINSNDVGIRDLNYDKPSNVFLIQGTTLFENVAGVYMTGNATEGLVLADCATFARNKFGVRGRDITLMIDAFNSSISPLDEDQPNAFLRDPFGIPQAGGAQKYIEICYELKAASGSVNMRNNYWGSLTGAGQPWVYEPTPQNHINLYDATCNQTAALPVVLPRVGREPENCELPERPTTDFTDNDVLSECTTGINSTFGLVHEQYHYAYYLLKADSVELARQAFEPLAALWSSDMSGYPANCRQYIAVARAIVSGAGEQLRPEGRAASTSTNIHGLAVWPNPAGQTMHVILPDMPCTLRVWDAYGHLVETRTASGNTQLQVSQWPSGVYYLESLSEDGIRKSAKAMVSH